VFLCRLILPPIFSIVLTMTRKFFVKFPLSGLRFKHQSFIFALINDIDSNFKLYLWYEIPNILVKSGSTIIAIDTNWIV
jgi:hypothetical protein